MWLQALGTGLFNNNPVMVYKNLFSFWKSKIIRTFVRCYLNSLYKIPLMLLAEGGSLVPLINVSLPTVWERGQVWRWTKLFIYFLIVKQPGCHLRCFLYLCVCCKWKAVRSEVILCFFWKIASAGTHWALSGPKQRYNFTSADSPPHVLSWILKKNIS